MYNGAGIVQNSEDHTDAASGTENVQQCGVDANGISPSYRSCFELYVYPQIKVVA